MIIPYGHEGLRVRGLPWVTVSIFVLCVVVFLTTAGASNRAAQESGLLFSEIAEIYLARPSLEIDPQLEELLFQQFGIDENEREVFLRSLKESRVGQPDPGSGPTQKELNALTHRFWTVYRGSPHYRWGVVPDDLSPVDLVTYQFLHGGWVHLLGNLLFLYLAAPHLEERWGRGFFGGFYLLAGVVAALFWALRYPGLDVPLVGASGSIAGLMGAFLICFGASKIRFFYWFFIIWGTFEAPAWLMLPMWLVMEVISGRTMDVLSQGNGGGGVAHWAHVWGFIFGMAFAGALHMLGIDAKLAQRTVQTLAPTDTSRGMDVPPRNLRRPAESKVALTVDGVGLPDDPPTVAPLGGESNAPPPSDEPPIPEVLEVSVDSGPAVEIRPRERLRILEGIPRSIDGPLLVFEVQNAPRSLDLSKIEAVAVGALMREGQRPFLLIDLLLDPPSDGTIDLRVVRFRSSSFDPRSIVGGDQAMGAFVGLVRRLISESGALPLPDEATISMPSRRSYDSIEVYEQEVLGVMG